MRLYFFRHAEAEYDAATDYDRELTQRGIRRTETAARVMVKLGLAPAYIYSSPRVRAEQTAKIAADALEMEVEITELLDFNFSLEAVYRLIRNLSTEDEVMFVGHNPSMSVVVEELTGVNANLKKGGLARVDIYGPDSGSGELVWLIAPKVFDALGS